MNNLIAVSAPAFRNRRAFTLLELLVVISIIAVLAGILLPVASTVMDNAKKTSAKVTMTNIVTAVKAYQTDYGQYPATPPEGGSGGGAVTAVDATFDKNAPSPQAGKYGRNHLLFDVLRAKNTTSIATGVTEAYKLLNSRRVTYFEAKDVKNAASARDGFIPSPKPEGVPTGLEAGDLVDPWGHLYNVRMDSNYSDIVLNPYPVTSETDNSVVYGNTGTNLTDEENPDDDKLLLHTGVIAWCAGKDGKLGEQSESGAGSARKGALSSTCDDAVSWQ